MRARLYNTIAMVVVIIVLVINNLLSVIFRPVADLNLGGLFDATNNRKNH